MQIKNHLYFFIHNPIEFDLSQIETKYLFGQQEENKLLFSDTKFEPAHSAYLKSRLDIMAHSKDYTSLIKDIKKLNICKEGFKVEYIVLVGDKTPYNKRLSKLKDIGYSVEGIPDYHNPTTTYALCNYKGTWCFGHLIKNKFEWQKHKQKPHSYSNSINMHIAKALVNIASKGDKTKKLLDACCGVGTIMLEACFAGYAIEGCDINWKICKQARENLAFFNYKTKIYRSDIKDLTKKYDAAIIDLPYNLFSDADENTVDHIIKYASEIANRLVIVSTSDIKEILANLGLTITDQCSVTKQGKKHFERKIWVCEKG